MATERFAASSSTLEDVDLGTFIWGSARFDYGRVGQSGSSGSITSGQQPAAVDRFFFTDLLFSRNETDNYLGASASGDELGPRPSDDDEEALRWAALERLPTSNRLRTAILAKTLGSRVVHEELDVTKIGLQRQQQIIDQLLRMNGEEDNARFLHKLRNRIDRYVSLRCINRNSKNYISTYKYSITGTMMNYSEPYK